MQEREGFFVSGYLALTSLCFCTVVSALLRYFKLIQSTGSVAYAARFISDRLRPFVLVTAERERENSKLKLYYERERERDRDRETETETDRQTDRQTDRHRDRQTERQLSLIHI